MKKLSPLLLAVAVWSGCMLVQRDPDVSNLKALEFGDARSVAIARIKGKSQAADALRGNRRISEWRAPASEAVAEIGRVFGEWIRGDLALAIQPLKPDEERVWLHSLCFDPGYAVRIETEHGRRDFLVCLECDEVEVSDDRGHSWRHHLERPVAIKVAALLGGS